MSEVKWVAIGAVGTVLGAIAVVVSIFYLGRQIRQNTLAIRTSATQLSQQFLAGVTMSIAQSDGLGKIWTLGTLTPERMNAEQGNRFHLLMHNFFIQFQATKKMYDKRLLDEEEWKWQKKGVGNFKGFPGFASWWEAAKQYFEQDFIDIVDDAEVGTPVRWDDKEGRFVAAGYPSGPGDGQEEAPPDDRPSR